MHGKIATALFCLTFVSASTSQAGNAFAQEILKTAQPLVGKYLESEPLVAKYLESGEISAGIKALTKHLIRHPQDQNERFGLGILYLMQGVEEFAQFQYKHGLLSHKRELVRNLPFLRLPLKLNLNPEEISYQKAGIALQNLLTNLNLAELTLSQVDTTNVKLPLRFGQIKLDMNGDGKATDHETFWKIYAAINQGNRFNRRRRIDEKTAAKFVIAFDGGDVYWLRGYCHFLMGIGDVVLAHDWQELFEHCAHLAYPKVKTKYEFLNKLQNENFFESIFDVIAAIHLINLEVVSPKRMKSALAHFEAMAELSQKSWDLIQKENDDDHEWLPNPKQKGVLGIRITQSMIETWVKTMKEFDLLLKGKKLIPFWRGRTRTTFGRLTDVEKKKVAEDSKMKGLNLRRVFTEPRRFDLVLWVQGTAAIPYLQKGEMTDSETWRQLRRIFQGNFIGFAAWFN